MPDVEARARLRVKAVTAVITTLTAASLLVFDWDASQGHETVFSGIRPALKKVLNRAYGVEPRPAGAQGTEETPGAR